MTHACEMAVDASGLAMTCREQEHQQIPTMSEPDSFLVVIEFDMTQ